MINCYSLLLVTNKLLHPQYFQNKIIGDKLLLIVIGEEKISNFSNEFELDILILIGESGFDS